jgi:hypothetical protein
VDSGSLSTILSGYQGQLNQMSMALLSATGILLYANRKHKKCLPLIFIILGGLGAAAATYFGLSFTEKMVNDFIKMSYVDNDLDAIAKTELFLIIFSAIFLGLASATSELE